MTSTDTLLQSHRVCTWRRSPTGWLRHGVVEKVPSLHKLNRYAPYNLRKR